MRYIFYRIAIVVKQIFKSIIMFFQNLNTHGLFYTIIIDKLAFDCENELNRFILRIVTRLHYIKHILGLKIAVYEISTDIEIDQTSLLER